MTIYCKNIISKAFQVLAVVLSLTACESLEVDNTDAPDRVDLLNSSRDFGVFAQNIYATYWQAIHGEAFSSPQFAALAAADQITASWFTFGCYELSQEPRIEWNNTPNYEYKEITYTFYTRMYTVLFMSNTTINFLLQGKTISSNNKINSGYLSYAYMMQGIALGQLALTFDSSQIVKETTKIENLAFSPYNEVMDSALESLEKAISIADTTNFTLGSNIINGVTLDNKLLSRVCHSFIARFLTLNARNKSEYAATDWSRVLANAKKGLTDDFGPQGDGNNRWFDDIARFLTNIDDRQFFYCKADNRIINLLDPSYPSRYWKNGHAKVVHAGYQSGEAISDDYRLTSDFEYSPTIRFYADRGTVHYSHYRFKRFDNIRKTGLGKLIEYPEYENKLYAIEAMTNMGNTEDAISAINNIAYPRRTRGKLSPVDITTTKKEMQEIIFYERDIELFGQGYLIAFCDMRRRDKLQKGTPLHFPVPANELQTHKHNIYTYGGVANADGSNTSNGGW